MSKNSPLPWRVELVPGSYKRPALVLSGDKTVANCLGDNLEPSATSIGEAGANAALIVEAVNRHDVLTARIAELHVALFNLELYLRDTPHHNCVQAAAARALLTKVQS